MFGISTHIISRSGNVLEIGTAAVNGKNVFYIDNVSRDGYVVVDFTYVSRKMGAKPFTVTYTGRSTPLNVGETVRLALGFLSRHRYNWSLFPFTIDAPNPDPSDSLTIRMEIISSEYNILPKPNTVDLTIYPINL